MVPSHANAVAEGECPTCHGVPHLGPCKLRCATCGSTRFTEPCPDGGGLDGLHTVPAGSQSSS